MISDSNFGNLNLLKRMLKEAHMEQAASQYGDDDQDNSNIGNVFDQRRSRGNVSNYTDSIMSRGNREGRGEGMMPFDDCCDFGRPSKLCRTIDGISGVMFGAARLISTLFGNKDQAQENTGLNIDHNDNSVAGKYDQWGEQIAQSDSTDVKPFDVFEEQGPGMKGTYKSALEDYQKNPTKENSERVKKLYLEGMEKFSNQIFNQYDKDKDGKITAQEYVRKELAKVGMTVSDADNEQIDSILREYKVMAGGQSTVDREHLTAYNSLADTYSKKDDGPLQGQLTADGVKSLSDKIMSNDILKVIQEAKTRYNDLYSSSGK